MITDEAIEAAAMAILGVDPETWEMQTGQTKERYREDARNALAAAGPFLMAAAWDEGYGAGKRVMVELMSPTHFATETDNPYGSQS